MITRVEAEGTVTITIVKRAGSKGLQPLQLLTDCPGGKNAAVLLYEELLARDQEGIDLEELLAMDARIGEAIETGEKEFNAIGAAYQRLRSARPRPAPETIIGF